MNCEPRKLTRRQFLAGAAAPALPRRAQTAIPYWRGFNLLDLFQALPREGRYPAPTTAEHAQWLRDWGFNFLRIPMDYWFWIDSDWLTSRTLQPEDTFRIRESALEKIDRLVELGRRHSLHISLNLHRAPGYCINGAEREPFVLWTSPVAEEAFVFHWQVLAQRYRGVPAAELSFNLLNEAPAPRDGYMTREDYARVMRRAIAAIRAVTPERLVFVDGLNVGTRVVEELVDTGVAQSVHAYWPGGVSHFRAAWVDRNLDFPEPSWPLWDKEGSRPAGRHTLEERFSDWADLARRGIGVHCGECGCFNRTPHAIALAWIGDNLDVLASHGIGFALWNLFGPFGILNSGRADAEYEDWFGAKLDRKLLNLLQRY